jgi:hypothetical protein
MQQPDQPLTKRTRGNPHTFEPILVKANANERLPLGRYREDDPEPKFTIDYEPAVPEVITHEIIKLPLNDGCSYTLSAHFQNFYDQDVAVTVRREG